MAKAKSILPTFVKAWAGLTGQTKSIDVTSKYKGMSLQQVEDELRNIKGHEEAVIFDKNMKVIAAYSGGDTSVYIPTSFQKVDGITITHNHPLWDTKYGATLSPSDVGWFANSKVREFRAVASGQGEHVYSLFNRGKQSSIDVKYSKAQLKVWPPRWKRDVTPKSDGGTGKLQALFDSEYNTFRNKGYSDSSAKHAAWQKATGVLERDLSEFVSNTGRGLTYFARNKKYKVNR